MKTISIFLNSGEFYYTDRDDIAVSYLGVTNERVFKSMQSFMQSDPGPVNIGWLMQRSATFKVKSQCKVIAFLGTAVERIEISE